LVGNGSICNAILESRNHAVMTTLSTPRVKAHRRRTRDRQGRCTPAPTPVSSAGRHRGLRGLAYKRETVITIARLALLPAFRCAVPA
jgi:hypothetical protein